MSAIYLKFRNGEEWEKISLYTARFLMTHHVKEEEKEPLLRKILSGEVFSSVSFIMKGNIN